MLQEDALLDWLTILDNCLLGLKITNNLNKKTKSYVIDLINKYGLKDFMNSYPKNLSGGMKQKVALIRTLAICPDILLLDEPFSALDYQTRLNLADEIYKIIWDKVKENNKKLTSYKAVRKIEIKKDEFEKTTTMKIKRFAEINKDNAKKKKNSVGSHL